MSKIPLTLFTGTVSFLIIGVFVFSGFYLHYQWQLRMNENSILEMCKNSTNVVDCYDSAVIDLMKSKYLSIAEAFDVVKFIQKNDPNYQYCHLVGHEIAVEATLRDPAEFKSVLSQCPSGICANGCIHGPILAQFHDNHGYDGVDHERLIPELVDACNGGVIRPLTPLEKIECVHALGHAFMNHTEFDIDDALDHCDVYLRNTRDQTSCYEGAFMQIFQPLDEDDLVLLDSFIPEKHKKTLRKFCSSFSNDKNKYSACWGEGWPIIAHETEGVESIVEGCSGAEHKEAVESCERKKLFFLAKDLNFNVESISNFCSTSSNQVLERRCLSSATYGFLQSDVAFTDEARALCGSADTDENTDSCYRNLANLSIYVFNKGSGRGVAFCKDFPEKWRVSCLALHK